MTLFVDTLQLPVTHLLQLKSIVKLNGDIDIIDYTPSSLLTYLQTNKDSIVDIVPWLRHLHGFNNSQIMQYFIKIIPLNIDIIHHINSTDDLPLLYYLMEHMEYKIYKRFVSGETNFRADGELITNKDKVFIKVTKRKVKIV